MRERLGFSAASTLMRAVVAMPGAIEKLSGAVRNGTGGQTLVRERI
jgi:hypothetical protein